MKEREQDIPADERGVFHDITNIFPFPSETAYAKLRTDIQQHGLCDPLWRYQGQIIDGRMRYRVCRELGIEPTYQEWDGQGSLVWFVVALNYRKLLHFSVSQRSMLGAEMKRWLEQEAQARTLDAHRRGSEKA